MLSRRCLFCHTEFIIVKNSNPKKFCNNSCSASYTNTRRKPRSVESRRKTSTSIKNNPSGFIINPNKRGLGFRSNNSKQKEKNYEYTKVCSITCQVCNKLKFVKGHNKLKTCSSVCARILRSKNISKANKGKPGIMRKRAGRGKSGLYRGFWLSSTYELAYLIYCLDHKIDIKRNKRSFDYFNPETKTWHKFYPDFLVNNELVEIKGYYTKLTDYKLSGIKEPIKVLYKKDLKFIFDYVEYTTRLKIKNLYLLYEQR